MKRAGRSRRAAPGGRAASAAAQQRTLVQALLQALRAREGEGSVERVETHISWVLVGGGQALKIKKAVDLGFVDFSTLERRQHFCEAEIRLNRRLAPQLYLDVTAIGGTAAAPQLGGGGPPIEFAVRMRAFDQRGLWDRLARAGELQPAQLDRLAERLARFHEEAEPASLHSRFGMPTQVRAAVLENFAALAAGDLDAAQRAQVAALRDWEAATFEAVAPLMERRRAAGRVRECHGDLHLGNIAQVDGHGTVFDCIEFNDDLRIVDVISEIAFLAMDLRQHGLAGHARRFLNRYFECCGDYDGVRLLRYYTVYRALVRAKVAMLRARQADAPPGAWRADLQRHLALACAQALAAGTGDALAEADAPGEDLPAALLITRGCSGSGKTTGSAQLVQACGALRVRADVERKRLFGLAEGARSGSAPDAGLYTPQATRATYERLLACAQPVIEGGHAALLDATWLDRAWRDEARSLATRLQVPFVILDFEADEALLRERVRRRASEGSDASEADEVVLGRQLARAAPLSHDERASALACPAAVDAGDPAHAAAWQAVARDLCRRLRGAGRPEVQGRWFAMAMPEAGRPLQQVWRERLPVPGRGDVRIEVAACGVCRTDLHIVDGELPFPGHPVVPGHEIVGRVRAIGEGVTALAVGQRVGVPWLGWTCGSCEHCRAGRENLCERARFTGWQIAGGYAQQVVADARYVFALPERYGDLEAAPLLCAGLIGWRAYAMAGPEVRRLGIYGFGAAAHLIAQVAVHQGREVYAFTRAGDTAAQQLARELGASWAGASQEEPPAALDAALIFAPVGALVPAALRAIRPGGTVVCAGIHMSDIPSFPYAWLWRERRIVSVANLTRADGEAFLRVAGEAALKVHVRPYALRDANAALDDLRAGRFTAAAVLQV